jgi:hypothetical protein
MYFTNVYKSKRNNRPHNTRLSAFGGSVQFGSSAPAFTCLLVDKSTSRKSQNRIASLRYMPLKEAASLIALSQI